VGAKMSFVPGFGHDVFLSYAWADNKFNNDWISNFRRYLCLMLRAGLDREGFRERELDELDVFIDEKGFERSGRVAEIVAHAGRSALLFVFVGKKYARSSWCAKELAAFAAAWGSLDAAIERTWTVVLEKDALRLEPESGEPDEACARLAELLGAGIQNHFFDEAGRTIRAFNPIGGEELNPTAAFEDRCRPIVEELVRKLVSQRRDAQRTLQDRRKLPPAPPSRTPPVAPAALIWAAGLQRPEESWTPPVAPAALMLVESNPEDAPLTEGVKDVIKVALDGVFPDLRREFGLPADMPPPAVEFDLLDWKEIDTMDELPRQYHGIVVVDGAKDALALMAQVNRLREKIWRSRPGMVQAMWILPPKREPRFKPDRFQILRFAQENGTVRCDQDELKGFLRRIVQALRPVPSAAAA
jgi:hypothetical protein